MQHFTVNGPKGTRCNCTVPEDRTYRNLNGGRERYAFANTECPHELRENLHKNGISLAAITAPLKLRPLPPKLPKHRAVKRYGGYTEACEHGKMPQRCCIVTEVA